MAVSLTQKSETLSHLAQYVDMLQCPACSSDLVFNANEVQCSGGHRFPIRNNVPLLFWQDGAEPVPVKKVTENVKAFYEETPFPNYDGMETVGDLIEAAQKGIFASLLNDQLPFNVRVLEVGCGTGQLSNFLGISNRFVFGTDMCLHSLELAQKFRDRHELERTGFYQMNLFYPAFKEESFHFVICNGVLHHTADPFGGFRSIAKLVKKGGFILIGLYNKYGRLATDIRRMIFNAFNDRFRFLDPLLHGTEKGDIKKNAWFRDQYKHPHESKHTFQEVLGWFERTGYSFTNSIPKLRLFERMSPQEQLFRKNPVSTRTEHFLAQIPMIFSGNANGGFFFMIGQRIK